MLRLSRIFTILIAILLISGPALKAQEVKNGLTWYTDVNKVYEVSKKTNKPIFAFFTGSDWCGWCHRLTANVFDKPGFKDWARQNVILLELDFPRNRQLPEELAKQNGGLQQFFQVQGFPTIWMFTMAKDEATKKFNITALGSMGYPQSRPGHEEETFLANARAVLKTKK